MKIVRFVIIAGLFLAISLSLATAQDKYAVLIGVEAYDTSTFENLDYASDDAEEIGETLDNLGFQTTVMTSESLNAKLRPTSPDKILDVIKSVLRSCGTVSYTHLTLPTILLV